MLSFLKNFIYSKYYRDLSILSFSSIIVTILNSLVAIPLFLLSWGVDKYGEWIFICALVGFVTVFTEPIASSYGVEVANNRNNKKSLEKYFIHYLLLLFIAFGLILLLYTVIFYFYFESNQLNYIEDKNVIYFLIIATAIIDSFIALLLGNLRFFSQYKKFIFILNIFSISKAGLLIVLLFLRMEPIYLCYASLVASLFMISYLRVACGYIWPALHYKLINAQDFKKSIEISFYRFLLGIGSHAKLNLEILILSSFLQPSILVMYTTTNTLINFMKLLSSKIHLVFVDKVSDLYSQAKYLLLKKEYDFCFTISMIFISIAAVSLTFFGEWIYVLWTKNNIVFEDTFFLSILFASIINCIWLSRSFILFVTNKIKFFSIIQFLFILFSLTITYFLTLYYGKYGIVISLITYNMLMLFYSIYSSNLFFNKMKLKNKNNAI